MENNSYIEDIAEITSESEGEKHVRLSVGSGFYSFEMDGERQGDPLMSFDLYRTVIKPRQKELFGFIKKRTDAYLSYHSCGSIFQFIPDLIEVGVDILNPIQVSAKDMNTHKLKREFGNGITFWGGGCDTLLLI